MVSDNVTSWVWLNYLLGSRRVGLFVLEPVSWIYAWWWEEAIEIIKFRALESAIHSIVTDEWKYSLFLIQVGRRFVCDVIIMLKSARPEISTLGVATVRHSKVSNDLLSHNVIQGLYVSLFRHCDVGGVTRSPVPLYII